MELWEAQLEEKNVIKLVGKYRSLRKDHHIRFGIDVERNSVHGSRTALRKLYRNQFPGVKFGVLQLGHYPSR